jgi:hypothetical protein
MKFPKLNITRIILSVAILYVLSACHNDDEIGVKIDKFYSTFRGYAVAYSDSYEYKDINVTIQKEDLVRKAKTDETGIFFFDSLETGTYNLIFEKEGFGTYKTFGIRHFGYPSDTLYKTYVPIFKKAVSVVQKTGSVNKEFFSTYSFLKIELNITNFQEYRESVIAFVSKDKNVSKDSYEFYLAKEYSSFWVQGDPGKNYKGISFPYSEILKNGYKNGDKIYFKFYTINNSDNGYTDYELKKQVFPTISSSEVPVLEYTLSF